MEALKTYRARGSAAADDHVPIRVDLPCSAGMQLRTGKRQRVVLGDPIASGGEASIHAVAGAPEVLCKIYHETCLTRSRINKLERMAVQNPRIHELCWPLAMVYDSSNTLRGFVMQRAEGLPLNQSLMFSAEFIQEHPGWTRRDSVKLVLNVLSVFKRLHQADILVGDVNDCNILMQPSEGVAFVDCDSFQIEGFPCTVGTDAYTPPELQGKAFRSHLRTKHNEAFAIAVLIFKIMVPGKHPFSHQNGGNLSENIRKGLFPYRVGQEKLSGSLPAGPWRFCWSHIPAYIKKAFAQVFMATDQAQRPGVDEWIRLFQRHANELSMPERTFTGNQRQIGFDLSILPQNYACWKQEHIRDRPQTDYAIHMEMAQGWITQPKRSSTSRSRRPALTQTSQHASIKQKAPSPRRRKAVKQQKPDSILDHIIALFDVFA